MGATLAFCAGTFLCIAGADLLPELQFHTHDRVKLTLALLAGLGVAVAIARYGHVAHEHAPEQPVAKVAFNLNAPKPSATKLKAGATLESVTFPPSAARIDADRSESV